MRCDPTAPWLSIEGGAQGVLVNDTLRVNGAIAPEASLPYLFLSGGTTGLEMNTKFAAVTGLGEFGGFCELAVINQAPRGVARLFLSTQNNAPAGGRGELVALALANGGVQLNALNQFISLNTTSGIANLAVEPNTGGSSNGEVIFGYGHLNASDRRLKTNIPEAYNARPHQAVTVAPEDVEAMPTATFRVYQDNATKFQHNKKLTEGRKRRLEEAGAFRAPTNARRSFEPQYGPAREIASIDSMVVRATDGTETLLKHALPVPRGSAEPKAKLTRPPVPLAIRQLQDFNPGPVAPP